MNAIQHWHFNANFRKCIHGKPWLKGMCQHKWGFPIFRSCTLLLE